MRETPGKNAGGPPAGTGVALGPVSPKKRLKIHVKAVLMAYSGTDEVGNLQEDRTITFEVTPPTAFDLTLNVGHEPDLPARRPG